MNFTKALQMAQVRPAVYGLLALFFFPGCSGSPPPATAYPEEGDPRAAVDRFMDAVKREDLTVMSRLWGTKNGPAATRMDPVTAERRLRLMQIYLAHDAYEVRLAEGELLARGSDTARYQVRLTRKNCRPVVPFTLVRFRGGWLIENIDLAQAGNPARRCSRTRNSIR